MSISYVVKCIRKLFKIFIFCTKILNLLGISIFSIYCFILLTLDFVRLMCFSHHCQKSSRQRVSARAIFRNKAKLATLRVFSSIAYVHVPKEKRRKLDAKAEKFILVGYSDEQKGYKCYNPRTKQARVSRDVVFDESASWYLPPTPIRALMLRSARLRCLRMSLKSGPTKRIRFHFG